MGGYWDFEADQDESGEWPSQSRPSGRDGAPPVAPPGAPPFDSGPENPGNKQKDSFMGLQMATQILVGRVVLPMEFVSILDVDLLIDLKNYEDEPLEIIYKGRKVAEAAIEQGERSGDLSIRLTKTIGWLKIAYLHFAAKDRVERAQITRFKTAAGYYLTRIHVQKGKNQDLLKDNDQVEITAELGNVHVPLLSLLSFTKNRPRLIPIDKSLKSRWPHVEPIRVKIFGQTVFLGKLVPYEVNNFIKRPRPNRIVKITEALI